MQASNSTTSCASQNIFGYIFEPESSFPRPFSIDKTKFPKFISVCVGGLYDTVVCPNGCTIYCLDDYDLRMPLKVNKMLTENPIFNEYITRFLGYRNSTRGTFVIVSEMGNIMCPSTWDWLSDLDDSSDDKAVWPIEDKDFGEEVITGYLFVAESDEIVTLEFPASQQTEFLTEIIGGKITDDLFIKGIRIVCLEDSQERSMLPFNHIVADKDYFGRFIVEFLEYGDNTRGDFMIIPPKLMAFKHIKAALDEQIEEFLEIHGDSDSECCCY